MTAPEDRDALHVALEARANRGTARGAPAVVEAATTATVEALPIGGVTPAEHRRRAGSRRRLAVAAALVLVVGIGVVVVRGRQEPTTATVGNPSIADAADTGVWETLSGTLTTDQLVASPNPIWTGREVLLPGLFVDPASGGGGIPSLYTQIPAFNPTSGQVRLIAAPPVAQYRWSEAPVVVWTGTEMILFGYDKPQPGREVPRPGRFIGGAAYNPTTDTWRVTSPPPADWEVESGVWAGDKALLVSSSSGVMSYDPAADRWTVLAPAGASYSPGTFAPLVWDGSELLAFDVSPARLVAFSPSSGTWRQLATPPFPVSSPVNSAIKSVFATSSSVLQYGSARVATYDRRSDSWTERAPRPLGRGDGARTDEMVAWTGSQLIVAGGQVFDTSPGSLPRRPTANAASYDPIADRWSPIPDLPASVLGRVNPINQALQETVRPGIWAGDRLVVFGLRDHVGGPNAPGGTLFAVAWKPSSVGAGNATGPAASSPPSASPATSSATAPIPEMPLRGTGPVTDAQTYAVRLALVGLPLADAEALAKRTGWSLRVVSVDGQALIVTDDLRQDRINLTVADGKITMVAFG